jgi:DNA-binding NarL/FixJ family response regulator
MVLNTLVVDDHEAARCGLVNLLNADSFRVTASTGDAQRALELAGDGACDLVLVDVQMKPTSGLDLLAAIRQQSVELPVVFVSAYDYPVYIARAVANGAHDYVLKSNPVWMIERALRYVCEHGIAYPGGLFDRVARKMREPVKAGQLPPEFPLTPREAQVLRHVAYGLSNREIATSLRISIETVKEHVQNILRKCGAVDRTEVAVRAVRLGLVDG